MADLSKEQLNLFLDWAAEKGLMKASSARSLKSACNAVLAVIEDEEAHDVTKLNIDSAMQRYQNLHGFGVSPRTLQAYSQRVKYAINEFENTIPTKLAGGHQESRGLGNHRDALVKAPAHVIPKPLEMK